MESLFLLTDGYFYSTLNGIKAAPSHKRGTDNYSRALDICFLSGVSIRLGLITA